MPLTATISITVPALPDNDIWFANSAAWSNYWEDITGDVTLDPVATTVYVPAPYDDNLAPHDLTVDDMQYVFPTIEQFASLVAQVAAVDNCLQLLRTQLRTGGLITNAQQEDLCQTHKVI